MTKRLFDLVFSLLLLIFFGPLLVVVALLLCWKLGRPIFFKQKRPGYRGKPFYIYKFRTMTDERGPDGKLLPDEQRLTALGKTLRKLSLDELPQLFSVLMGDMSLVGPRPLLMEYLPLYDREQNRRHEVKPGITGWAQVKGRNAISWENKFALDVWYVDNRGFLLDMKILWFTLLKVLKREGVNQEGQATAEKFTGSSTDT